MVNPMSVIRIAHPVCTEDQSIGLFRSGRRMLAILLAMLVMAVLAACGTSKPSATSSQQGTYRVVKGDTLTQIARRHGQSVQSLMRMNNLRDPNRIRVGQVLVVRGGSAASAPAPGAAGSGTVVPRPPVKGTSVAAPRSIKLVWPAKGSSRRGTTASTTQGVYIAGQVGSPVNAAAGGKVVYAGSGLRGYGNMVIINHDANFLSVYAHNHTLLVKEGATVKQGQQIATMGDTDSSTVNLYFELRYNGKPVDALRYLP